MRQKVAFVLGGAKTLREDLNYALALLDGQPDTWIACNHAGRDLVGTLDHWCTLHTEKMPAWIEQREERGLGPVGTFWTSNVKTIPPEHENLYQKVVSWDGSSGLLAITVALHLGYEKIILCGIPLDKKEEHYDYPGVWMDAPRYRSAWSKHLSEMNGLVKSPSGWTALLLGEPTKEWLDATN